MLAKLFRGIFAMPTAKIDFQKGSGLVPVIVQDYQSRDVLMVAYMNEEAWEKTKESGNFQEVIDAFIDCDNDTILLQVKQIGGAACHEGYRSCFFRKRANGDWKVIAERVFDPKEVYKK